VPVPALAAPGGASYEWKVNTEQREAMEYWKVDQTRQGIVITCRGNDRTDSVQRAVQDFDALAKKRSDSFAIIADVREMTGYQSPARRAWQEILRVHRAKIQRLVMVGARSVYIRMGASVVAAFAGVPVRFVDDWAGVEALERESPPP
jgi:hypothetical protein